jgi:hypothetical protein
VKSAYLTKNRTKTASITYAGRSKERSWEEDEIDNIMKMDRALEVKCKRESVSFMV